MRRDGRKQGRLKEGGEKSRKRNSPEFQPAHRQTVLDPVMVSFNFQLDIRVSVGDSSS